MEINEAMLAVAKKIAKEYGFTFEKQWENDGSKDNFWANKLLGFNGARVESVRYTMPNAEVSEERRPPVVEIDMYWGKPRLNVCLVEDTFACITYEDGHVLSTQTHGDNGLKLAMRLQEEINELIKYNDRVRV